MKSGTPLCIFITGGTSGIGLALVEQYLQKGYTVHTCGRDETQIQKTKNVFSAYSQKLSVLQADLSKFEECEKWIQQGIELYGNIDVLLLNAGMSMRALVADTQPSVVEKIMQINFIANVHLVHHALPFLEKTKGTIAGISSMAGFVGLPGRAGYCASKAALNMWLDALRKELRSKSISVVTIAPGFVASSIRQKAFDGTGMPANEDSKADKNIMTAESCARIIIQAIHQKKSLHRMGLEGKLAIWLSRYFPSVADKLIAEKYIKDGKLMI